MNPKTRDLDLTRRRFVGACCASVGSTGLVSTLAQLRLMGGAASPDTLSTPARAGAPAPDFKALVCLFFAGGNDANNLVVPADNAGYTAYSAARTALSLPQSSLLPITTPGGDGRAWALHPAMTELKSLYDRSKLAVIANTGTLAYPRGRSFGRASFSRITISRSNGRPASPTNLSPRWRPVGAGAWPT